MKPFLYILLFFVPSLVRGQQSTNLWLEIPSITNGSVPVVLHNVQPGKLYQLLSKTTLTDTAWKSETALQTTSNQDFIAAMLKPLPGTEAMFFWATGGNFSSTYIPNGLLEWNKLNDGTGTNAADASGNGNTLPLIGSPTWETGYLTLDGSTQYGDAGSNQLASLDLHDLTLCTWLNKADASFKAIVDKSFVTPGVGYGGWSLRVDQNNRLNWWVQDNQDLVDQGAATIVPGEWVFVSLVWHYTQQKADFYLDGVLNSTVGNGAANQHPSDLASLEIGNMGNNSSGGQFAFNGSLRDVAIYNRALSADEIGRNYLGSEFVTNVIVPDLLYYKFTEYEQVNPPVQLADSSLLGAATGTLFSDFPTTLQWETNEPSVPTTALHFNGVSTHIDTSNSVIFNFTTNLFTINLWMRPLTANGCIMENGIAQQNGWDLSVGGTYQVQFSTETEGSESTISTGPGAANVGVFTMVTIVRTGPTTALIYINGAPAATTGSITIPASSTNSLVIGTDRAGAHHLDGDLCLPQIWSEALPPTAIANLYLIQSAGKPWP